MRRAAALLLLALPVLADGKFFGKEVAAVAIPDQSALLVWDDGRETLVVSSAFSGKGSEFAWLVPVPSPPEIRPSTAGLFPTLRAMTAPVVRKSVPATAFVRAFVFFGSTAFLALTVVLAVRWRRVSRKALLFPLVGVAGWMAGMASISMPFGLQARFPERVAVVRRTVGSYDTATLRARSASDVTRWLSSEGFRAPEGVEPVLQRYLDEGWHVVAARLLAEGSGRRVAHPLAFRFDSPAPVYPMRLTGVDATPLELDLFVAGRERAAAPGLRERSCDRMGDGYRREHPEIRRWIPEGFVVTHLHGSLAADAMQSDLAPVWRPFERLRPSFFSDRAVERYAGAVLGAAVVLLGLGLAVAVSRQLSRPAGSFLRRAGIAVVVALAAGVALRQTIHVLPRGTVAAPDGETVTPRDARARVLVLADELFAKKKLSLDALRRALRKADLEEYDGPGGFTLQRDDDGSIHRLDYSEDGSVGSAFLGRESRR